MNATAICFKLGDAMRHEPIHEEMPFWAMVKKQLQ
jgi:hypothetical protein